eukprot:TRINITY_DN9142_c0_g1_i1.p2 TRINITY_DN9142_c0_g1~~TRINITY_DN9142_c0_g1_i1.p2  ORF type:complete len:333 (+),score=110.72 TRINITY_DN9142_c0_g1_i1:1566-2564(+)
MWRRKAVPEAAGTCFAAPPPTENCALVVLAGTPLLLGGYSDTSEHPVDDVLDPDDERLACFALTEGGWRYTALNAPALEGLTATVAPAGWGRDAAVIVGGVTDCECTHLLTVLRVVDGAPAATAPSSLPRSEVLARSRHAACADGSAVWVFGGTDTNNACLSDLVRVTEGGCEVVRCSAQPDPRFNASMCCGEEMLWLFGGAVLRGGDQYSHQDLWCFSAAEQVWREVAWTSLPPVPRNGHVSFMAGANIVVIAGAAGAASGGGATGSYDDDVLVIDPAKAVWRTVAASGDVPSARYMPGCWADGSTVLLVGGNLRNEGPSDMYELNLAELL